MLDHGQVDGRATGLGGLCLGMCLSLLTLLESMRRMAHARERQEGIDPLCLANCRAFLGKMACQAVESAAWKVLSASVGVEEKEMISYS